MDIQLDDVEARIFGVLVEKQMATPDYYPLTLNALVNACNQKTNRDPVMELDGAAVEEALGRLRHRQLVWQVKAQGSRALKYEHNLQKIAEFSDREQGILCMLLLRGPQTAGELRARTVRLAEFHGLAAIEHTLQKLIQHEKGPFVVRLGRRPGHKENRYAHLFGDIDPSSGEKGDAHMAAPQIQEDRGDMARVDALQKRVEDLETVVQALKAQLEDFKRQFE
jgi:uncharacterized protein YceH (UPF0502 family)